MTVSLVDFHCHLDLFPDHAAEFAACDREGVHTLTVTTTPKAWPHNRELAARTRHVRPALGLHPQLVGERADELVLWERYLTQARFVGEVGLDGGPRFYQHLGLQKLVFERILRSCADAGGKILTVHSVRAVTTVLDMVEKHLPASRGRVVLHWFTGTRTEAQRAIDLGCYFSVNAEMLRSERHRKVVSGLPIDRLLTETDGPFAQDSGNLRRPRDTINVIKALGQLFHLQTEAMATTILANLDRLELGGST